MNLSDKITHVNNDRIYVYMTFLSLYNAISVHEVVMLGGVLSNCI
jgi:hypothetical protein